VRSNREWIRWGKEDPLYGVLTFRGRDARSEDAWTPEEFMQYGEADFADILPHWRSYGMGSRRCIEIGCGAGRMTRQLLSVFEEVVAVDVSDEQIELARNLLGDAAARVTFAAVSEPAIPAEDSSCDGMFTTLVFQHFSDVGGVEDYVRLTHAKLEPGASVCFQIPVIGAHGIGLRVFARYTVRRIGVAARRLRGDLAVMDYRVYTAARIFRMLEEAGFVDAELRVFRIRSRDEFYSFFFARKPDGGAEHTPAATPPT
jgi:SAM-dependent methyltransferase